MKEVYEFLRHFCLSFCRIYTFILCTYFYWDVFVLLLLFRKNSLYIKGISRLPIQALLLSNFYFTFYNQIIYIILIMPCLQFFISFYFQEDLPHLSLPGLPNSLICFMISWLYKYFISANKNLKIYSIGTYVECICT